ncbi:unnamed protein product [Phyllotreta striolata]|uniref:Uncharacterized protein n=1 Tax=Phyllotreta striolata TaxID=444603 RepID=A0A9N9XRC0_PHYSR|nr:unnamed protein product [Phyllotreta striolata]
MTPPLSTFTHTISSFLSPDSERTIIYRRSSCWCFSTRTKKKQQQNRPARRLKSNRWSIFFRRTGHRTGVARAACRPDPVHLLRGGDAPPSQMGRRAVPDVARPLTERENLSNAKIASLFVKYLDRPIEIRYKRMS